MKVAKLKLSTKLAELVRQKYVIAKDYKQSQGVFDTLTTCVKMLRGEPIVELADEIKIDVTANIASPIARGIVGMLRDIYGQNTDAPFVLEPTPVVELPAATAAALKEGVYASAGMLLEAAGYDQAELDKSVAKIEELTKQEEFAAAQQAAEKLTVVIRDKLVEGGWRNAFEHEALQHFVVYPTLILKCPVYKEKQVKHWDGNDIVSQSKTVLTIEAISPFNFYPSPDALDAQQADYVIERRRMTYSEVRSLAASEGFDEDGLDAVVEKYPDGYIEPYENSADSQAQIETNSSGNADLNPTKAYDTIGYFGAIKGKALAEYGVVGVDETTVYEAEVWIIGDFVIKAVLNPDRIGRRPFYTASFEPIPNSFWGECPMTRIIEHQRACTSAIAHLFYNLSFSSGPVIEREVSRLAADSPSNSLSPYEIIDVKENLSGSQSMVHRRIDINSKAGEISAIFDKFKAEAYEAIGIPKALFGGTDGMGTIGRTSGGIATIYAQGSKAIKYAMRLLEERIIEPAIQRIVDEIITDTLDMSLKGDIQVRARGVSGIIEKETKRDQLNWAMQTMVPLMQLTDETGKPLIPRDAPVRLLYEQFKSLGIPTAGIFEKDYDKEDVLFTAPAVAPDVVAQPSLDNRSPDAVAAIADMGGAGMSTGEGFGGIPANI